MGQLYDLRHHALVTAYGLDLGVQGKCYAAFALFCLGYPDQARQKVDEALTLAHKLHHPHTTASALTWVAGIHHSRREVKAAREHAEAVIALAQGQGFPYWLSFGLFFRGWALAIQSKGITGAEQVRQGLTTLQSTGTVCCLRFGAALLVEAYGRVGEVEEGLATVNEVLRALDQPGDHLWDAELYRLKGPLLLAQESKSQKAKVKRQKSKMTDSRPLITDPQAEAEACFLKALEIARHQGAKLWELRAVTSLARLWQQQGKGDEAWQMLADVYNWFTEGFDTNDLQEAKRLLEELHH